MNLAAYTRVFLCVCLPVSPSPRLPVLRIHPDGARELAQARRAAHLAGEERDAARAQRLELARERAEPARLHASARAAEVAGGVLALDAVDDEVCDGHAFVPERAEVARALLEGQSSGRGDEDEAGAR